MKNNEESREKKTEELDAAIRMRLDNMNPDQPIIHYSSPEFTMCCYPRNTRDEEYILLRAILQAANRDFLRSIKMPFLSDDVMKEYGEYYRLMMRLHLLCWILTSACFL